MPANTHITELSDNDKKELTKKNLVEPIIFLGNDKKAGFSDNGSTDPINCSNALFKSIDNIDFSHYYESLKANKINGTYRTLYYNSSNLLSMQIEEAIKRSFFSNVCAIIDRSELNTVAHIIEFLPIKNILYDYLFTNNDESSYILSNLVHSLTCFSNKKGLKNAANNNKSKEEIVNLCTSFSETEYLISAQIVNYLYSKACYAIDTACVNVYQQVNSIPNIDILYVNTIKYFNIDIKVLGEDNIGVVLAHTVQSPLIQEIRDFALEDTLKNIDYILASVYNKSTLGFIDSLSD